MYPFLFLYLEGTGNHGVHRVDLEVVAVSSGRPQNPCNNQTSLDGTASVQPEPNQTKYRLIHR